LREGEILLTLEEGGRGRAVQWEKEKCASTEEKLGKGAGVRSPLPCFSQKEEKGGKPCEGEGALG